jgi:hypothetical protein
MSNFVHFYMEKLSQRSSKILVNLRPVEVWSNAQSALSANHLDGVEPSLGTWDWGPDMITN